MFPLQFCSATFWKPHHIMLAVAWYAYVKQSEIMVKASNLVVTSCESNAYSVFVLQACLHATHECDQLNTEKADIEKVLLPWNTKMKQTEIDSSAQVINPMRTTCRLVKMKIWSYIEPIADFVRKNSLISKFVMHCYQTCFMIDLRNDQITILTTHIWC